MAICFLLKNIFVRHKSNLFSPFLDETCNKTFAKTLAKNRKLFLTFHLWYLLGEREEDSK